MRVSSGMMTNNYLRQLNNQYKQQSDLMEQSDGSRIHRPSDDPVAFVKTMTYKSSLDQNEQNQDSANTALSWMKTTDNTMVAMTDILKSIVEKTTAAANGTNTEKDTAATGEEIEKLIEELVSQANTQLGDQYIFSGQADKTKPYTTETIENKADIKTLDDAQTAAFGTKEMLVMTDSDSNTYYLDTASGNLYSKDYVDKGYKKTLTDNSTATKADQKAAVQGNKVGTLDGFNAATLFTNETNGGVGATFNVKGQLNTANSFTSTMNGTSTALTFSTSDKTVAVYAGDNVKISVPIQSGVANTPRNDSVNSTGVDVFGTDLFNGNGTELINNLYEIARKMKNGDTDWLSSDGITLANDAHNQVLNAETEVAARYSSYDLSKTTMENQNTQIQTDITNTSATDVAKLIVQLKTTQTLYNMSLQVGSNILPLSLADYLR
ncbi:flagellar hook-associated protein FlgL [Anaerosinus massiliensis]|uniref:flagellar hook-associated protein FlgL n=1 Tax=Massilibacillus massiliensis TaxID=1806837 RepID=UPI000DA6040E|nr:flagellar hook-associated protein FlgL [Massilibacillus massiliensis]